MASIAPTHRQTSAADSFFLTLAISMAFIVVAGFSTQFVMGRSTFAARPLVHLHGLAFMGWVGIFVTQAWLATHGPIALHRKLGWIGAGWIVLLIIMGCLITVNVTQRGTAPFFFRPQYFLIANPLGTFCFALLAWFAIRMRKQTAWHMRLHICAMASIMGPAFGRLLPMPLLVPNSFDFAVSAGLMFPLAGMLRDWRRDRRIHLAWLVGVLAMMTVLPMAHLIAYSPAGDAIYAAVTKGHPGAAVPGLEFAPAP